MLYYILQYVITNHRGTRLSSDLNVNTELNMGSLWPALITMIRYDCL